MVVPMQQTNLRFMYLMPISGTRLSLRLPKNVSLEGSLAVHNFMKIDLISRLGCMTISLVRLMEVL